MSGPKNFSQLLIDVSELLEQQREANETNKKTVLDDKSFCTTNNFESAIVYLSRELQGIGLGNLNISYSPQRSSDLIDGAHKETVLSLDLICLINRCWESIQLYRSSLGDSSTLKEQRKQDVAVTANLQTCVAELQKSTEDNQRKCKEAIELKRQALESKHAAEESLRKSKEEVKHLTSVLQQRENQLQHELRKKDQFIQSLKDRLAHLVSSPSNIVEKRMELTAPLPSKQDKPRAKWNTADNTSRYTDEMYRKVVAQYETWIHDLSSERDCMLNSLQNIAVSLQNLVKKHAKTMTPEEMAASLTDSVYSTDSLDEPVHQSATSTSPLDSITRSCTDSLLQLSVMLTEKASSDLKEARVKRIHELTADAMIFNAKTCKDSNKENRQPESKTAVFTEEEIINETKRQAIIQLIKHLGLAQAFAPDTKQGTAKSNVNRTPLVSCANDSQTPRISINNNSPNNVSDILPPSTSTPELTPSPHTPGTPMSDGAITPGDRTGGTPGECDGWLQRAGGPDDSTSTEIINLKKKLEEEREAVKRERECYAQAVLRLNRERTTFEQERLELLKQEFLQELPPNLKQECEVDASFYQASRVPAWISEHHCLPFSQPDSPLVNETNFTLPPDSNVKEPIRRDTRKSLGYSSSRPSAATSRTPSVSRNGDGSTMSKRTIPRSISSGSGVANNMRRSPSVTRLVVPTKENSKKNTPANSESRYPFSRDTLRPNVKSHDCSRNNSRDSSVSRVNVKGNKTSINRYNSLPRSFVSSNGKTQAKTELNVTGKQGAYNNFKNVHSRDKAAAITRLSLPARQGIDTPPSRYGARKTNTSRNVTNHSSNSLPRKFGQTQPHLISSTNLSDKFEDSRHAKSLDSPAGSNNPNYDLGSTACRLSLQEGVRRDLPKSTKVNKAQSLYGQLTQRPDDVFSVDSGYPSSEKCCYGRCRKILNISSDHKCLCHLFKQRSTDLEDSYQAETIDTDKDESEVTNSRIVALEESLMHLMAKIEGRSLLSASNCEDSPSDLSSSVCDSDIAKFRKVRSNSISEINPSASLKSSRKKISSVCFKKELKSFKNCDGLDALLLEDRTSKFSVSLSPSVADTSGNDSALRSDFSSVENSDALINDTK